MKVRSLLLSMCAIAALASCSKNDDGIPGGGSDAQEARVTIQLANEQAPNTKANLPGQSDAVINTLSALFYNDAGVLIGKPTSVTSDNQTVKTTSEACKVVLVANVPTTTDLTKATTLSALEALTFSSVGTASPYIINQTATNLTMVGAVDFQLIKGSDGVYTSTAIVQMHFIAAKIISVNLTIDPKAAATENYSTTGDTGLNDLTSAGTKWYYFSETYLQLANTVSQLYPGDVSNWTKFNSKMQVTDFRYIGGKAWDSTQSDENNPWDEVITPTPLQTDNYKGKILFTSGSFSPVFENTYLLENNNTVSHKTVLVLHGKCKVKDVPGADPAYKIIDRYWNITFGANTTDQPYLQAGNSYTINLKISKSFNPDSGTAGGGGGDPTVEVKDANVVVTVTPAVWKVVPIINKEWK